MATITQRGTSWQLNFTKDGKRKRKSYKTRDIAMTALKLMENPAQQDVPTTFKDFSNYAFDILYGDMKSSATVKSNLNVINKFLPKGIEIGDITPSVIHRVVQEMKVDGSSNSSINRKLSVIKKVIGYATSIGFSTVKINVPSLVEPKGRSYTLSGDDYNKARAFFMDNDMLIELNMFLFLYHTGCRLSEMFEVSVDDFEVNTVTFRDTKNGTDRTIPIAHQIRETFNYIKGVTQSTQPFKVISVDVFRASWNKMRDSLGHTDNKEFVPHMLRHSCATRLVKNGVSLPVVMKWMGHKTISTTMQYTHLDVGDLQIALTAAGCIPFNSESGFWQAKPTPAVPMLPQQGSVLWR